MGKYQNFLNSFFNFIVKSITWTKKLIREFKIELKKAGESYDEQMREIDKVLPQQGYKEYRQETRVKVYHPKQEDYRQNKYAKYRREEEIEYSDPLGLDNAGLNEDLMDDMMTDKKIKF